MQFVETMTGIRAVKAFRKEKRNEEEFGELVEDYRHVERPRHPAVRHLRPGLVLIGNVTVAVVLLVGGFRVVDGQLAIGALLAVVLYTRRFFDPMEDMAMFYNSYQSAAAALEKISGVLEERPSVPDPTRPIDLWTATGHVSIRRRRVRLHRRPGHPADVRPRHSGRPDHRARRLDGGGQVDAREADLALLRPDRRAQ